MEKSNIIFEKTSARSGEIFTHPPKINFDLDGTWRGENYKGLNGNWGEGAGRNYLATTVDMNCDFPKRG